MANDNQLTIIGTLVEDPELKYTPNGAAVANMRIVWNRDAKDEVTGEWKHVETGFFGVTAWRSLAENAAESLTKGMRVFVVGRLQHRTWENQEGEKRSVVEIVADDLGPSLKWATARVEKTRGGGGGSSSSGGGDWSRAPIGSGATSGAAADTEEAPF